MSGYWKQDILDGHKTGPYRTSIESIHKYEHWYKHLTIINNSSIKKTFLHPRNIQNLEPISNDITRDNLREPTIKKFDSLKKVKEYFEDTLKKKDKFKNTRGPNINNYNNYINEDGFYVNNLRGKNKVMSFDEIENNKTWGINDTYKYRLHPC